MLGHAKHRLIRSAFARRAVLALSSLNAAALARASASPAYETFARRGFHLLRKDYYAPVPDEVDLEGYWDQSSELPGVEIDEARALTLFDDVIRRYADEFKELFPTVEPESGNGFYVLNETFMAIDAETYYALIRHFHPRRIIEIGAGNSTLLAAAAVERLVSEGSQRPVLTAIDPYPPDYLSGGVAGLAELVPERVQRVGLETFTSLEENDILFIDSSHALRAGGDVQLEYCEILPRLQAGVLVHVHDISLPKAYPRPYFEEQRWFWNEQYLLQAFLAFNSRFEIIWPAAYMTQRHRARLEEAFPTLRAMTERYPASEPSSFWMRVR